MDTQENAQAIVDLFNEFYKADPEAATKLFSTRVACNDAVADHPSIIVSGGTGEWRVGIAGVLNGLFGEEHRIAMLIEDDGRLSGFKVAKVSSC